MLLAHKRLEHGIDKHVHHLDDCSASPRDVEDIDPGLFEVLEHTFIPWKRDGME